MILCPLCGQPPSDEFSSMGPDLWSPACPCGTLWSEDRLTLDPRRNWHFGFLASEERFTKQEPRPSRTPSMVTVDTYHRRLVVRRGRRSDIRVDVPIRGSRKDHFAALVMDEVNYIVAFSTVES